MDPSDNCLAQEELRQALQQEQQKHLGTLSDFANFRKRVSRDLECGTLLGKQELTKDLLPILDNLERALVLTEEERVRQGILLIQQQLLNILIKHGLEPIDSLGQTFDPKLHQGLGYVQSIYFLPGQVAEEHSRGYKFHEQLIRPARVRVAMEAGE